MLKCDSSHPTEAPKTFCIILCVADALDFFDAQVASLAQFEQEVSLLISLDCSTDSAGLKAKGIVKKYFDESHVTFIQGPRKGFLENFMYASRFAMTLERFDFYAFCDQDDIWKETKLSRAQDLLTSDSDIPELYASSTNLINQNGEYLGIHKNKPIDTFSMSLVENICPGNAMVFNRAALALFTDTSEYNILYHDWWIFILTIEFGKVFFDPEPQVDYRQHIDNTISAGASSNKVLSSFRRSRYYDSISRNVEALLLNDIQLSQESAKTLLMFQDAFSYNPFRRLYGLWRSGVKRASVRGTFFLYLLVLLAPGLQKIRSRYNLLQATVTSSGNP